MTGSQRVIQGPIITVTGAIMAKGYSPDGQPFSIDLTGASSASVLFEITATQEGYIAALQAELRREREVSAELRREMWFRSQRDLWPRKHWWSRKKR